MGNALYGSGTAPQPRDPWEEDIIQDIAKKLEELGYPAMNDNAKLQLLRLFQDEKSWSQVDKALFHSDVVATLELLYPPTSTFRCIIVINGELTELLVDKYLTKTGLISALPEFLDKFLGRFVLQSLSDGVFWKLPGNPPQPNEELGIGNLGVIYSCMFSESSGTNISATFDNKPVAIKIMRPDLNDKLKTDFLRSAERSTKVRHMNIISAYGAFLDPEVTPTILMASIDLKTYCASFRASSLTLDAFNSIASDISKGMNYLHLVNISNIDMDIDNVVKIGDLSRYKIYDPTSTLTPEEVEKKRVLPPESRALHTQKTAGLLPESRARFSCGKACDLWSFGVLCEQILIESGVGIEKKDDSKVVIDGKELRILFPEAHTDSQFLDIVLLEIGPIELEHCARVKKDALLLFGQAKFEPVRPIVDACLSLDPAKRWSWKSIIKNLAFLKPPDFSKAEQLHEAFQPEQTLVEFFALSESDPTGYALFNCAELYNNGLDDNYGIKPRDPIKATKLYKKAVPMLHEAVAHGHIPSTRALAQCYDFGFGLPVDSREAARLYQIAADKSDVYALLNLGNMYVLGEGVYKDEAQAMSLFLKASDLGYPEAQFNAAVMYERGTGVSKDYQEAARLYRIAAGQGHARAQNNLGYLYEKGNGVPEDHKEAARFYKLAMDQGHIVSHYNLGSLYFFGYGVEEDKVEAARLFSLAADAGHPPAQFSLACMHFNAVGVKEDKIEAIRLYKLSAEQGYASAQYNLAVIYELGNYVPQNKVEAARLYKLAAEQGDALAQNAFYNLHNQGSAKTDPNEALRYLRLSAAQGYVLALYNLGNLYYRGDGVKEDKTEAARLFRLAADQGHAGAQNNLAHVYATGEGVDKDLEEAVRLYTLASDQGDEVGQYNLGCMLKKGEGSPVNLPEALRVFKLSAEKGYYRAQHTLGTIYWKGEGVEPDVEEARKMFKLAADQGFGEAKQALAAMAQ